MTDEPFDAPNSRPTPRQRQRGEPLWSFQNGGVEWSAEIRFQGAGVGWEPQIFKNGEFVSGRRFILRDEAIGWAAAERAAIEKGDA